jgi:hypothetical protein
MFGWWKRRQRASEGLLSQEQAKAVIEEEIRKRGWQAYDNRRYALERRKGRPLWICLGRVGHNRGGAMAIHIDARTGDLVRAVAGGR